MITSSKQRGSFILTPAMIDEWAQRNGDPPQAAQKSDATKVWWRCSVCGHEWMASIRARFAAVRRGRGTGCPGCFSHRQSERHRKPRPGQSVADVPFLFAEWHASNDRLPREVAWSSNEPARWTCGACGWEWLTPPSDRRKGHGCPRCSVVRRGCIADDVRLLMEWSDHNEPDPRFVARFSSQKYRWVCRRCTYEWSAKPAHRSNGRGCPNCARRGFNSAEKAILYFLVHDELDHWQFGIANGSGEKRLAKHAYNGWHVLEVRHYERGVDAQRDEQAIKRWMKRNGIRSNLTRADVPQGGWTECLPREFIPNLTLGELMEAVE